MLWRRWFFLPPGGVAWLLRKKVFRLLGLLGSRYVSSHGGGSHVESTGKKDDDKLEIPIKNSKVFEAF